MAPIRAWCPGPPVSVIRQIHWPSRFLEYQRSWNQIFGWGSRIVGRIQLAFRDCDIARRVDETRELLVGDGMPIHPKAIDAYLVDRALLGIEVFRTHEERATRNPQHIPRHLSLRDFLRRHAAHSIPPTRHPLRHYVA